MTALIVIASIVAALWLLLSVSLTVYVHITDDVSVKVGALGYKYQLLPERDQPVKLKKAKPKKKPTTEKKPPAKKKKVDKLTFGETVEMVLSGISAVLKPTGKLLSRLRLTTVDIRIAVCDDAADETAIKFGEVATAIYSVLGYLNQLITVRIKRVDIRPDFVGDEDRYDMRFKVKLRLYSVLGAVISIFARFFVNIIKAKMNTDNGVKPNLKGEQHNEQSSN